MNSRPSCTCVIRYTRREWAIKVMGTHACEGCLMPGGWLQNACTALLPSIFHLKFVKFTWKEVSLVSGSIDGALEKRTVMNSRPSCTCVIRYTRREWAIKVMGTHACEGCLMPGGWLQNACTALLPSIFHLKFVKFTWKEVSLVSGSIDGALEKLIVAQPLKLSLASWNSKIPVPYP